MKVEQLKEFSAIKLNKFRDFYLAYPQINNILSAESIKLEDVITSANKNNALVEYTTTGMSNEVFVSKYLVALPSKTELENFIAREIRDINTKKEEEEL